MQKKNSVARFNNFHSPQASLFELRKLSSSSSSSEEELKLNQKSYSVNFFGSRHVKRKSQITDITEQSEQ